MPVERDTLWESGDLDDDSARPTGPPVHQAGQPLTHTSKQVVMLAPGSGYADFFRRSRTKVGSLSLQSRSTRLMNAMRSLKLRALSVALSIEKYVFRHSLTASWNASRS